MCSLTSPVETCTVQAQAICLNCQTVALCDEDENNPGTFTTRNYTQSSCSQGDGEYCDDTSPFDSGTCFRYSPAQTKCACDGTTNCQKDPNNGNVYIPCEGANLDVTGTAFYCESTRIQMDTCTCFEGTLATTTTPKTTESTITEIRTTDSVKSTTPRGDPANTCTVQAQAICLNCQMVALCDEDENNPGTFITRNSSQCLPSEGSYCDDTSPLDSGLCLRYNPANTKCACDGTTNCQNDPNNPNVYIPCEGANLDITGTAFYCESARIQLGTCTCFEGTITTTLTTKNTELTSQLSSAETSSESSTVVTTTLETSSLTSKSSYTSKLKSTTPEFTETTTQIVTCPSDCPYVDDPSDDCSKYYFCYNGMNIPHECPDSLCFSQDECLCVPTATSSTKPQSTTTESPSTTTKQPSTTTELPSTTTTTTTEQPSTTTKPPSTVTEPPTTTTKSIFTTTENPTPTIIDFSSTTTELTCSSDCPYVDDPTDECSKYYYCSAEGNLEQECPPSFCFDQSACQCLPSQTTSIPITCSAECPYADDPTDGCSKLVTAEFHFVSKMAPIVILMINKVSSSSSSSSSRING
ncbi:hypothetical protein Anas_10149 [Armadillidium nasatum]|uniref:Chitin-binding type-2 domain-containing protein n=1 Tax=Armadillidium nasatum TaxID=96803 RepID=A0A5N5T9P5_9CRUS|nr:hypothetical protein Anas_10149 [Armadillidium nasatum]